MAGTIEQNFRGVGGVAPGRRGEAEDRLGSSQRAHTMHDYAGAAATAAERENLRKLRLAPEIAQQMRESKRLSDEARDAPLLAEKRGALALSKAIEQQAARGSARTSAERAATQFRGANVGAQIAGQTAESAAEEQLRREQRALNLSKANMALSTGSAIAALESRLKDYASERGIELNEKVAVRSMLSTGIGTAAKLYTPPDPNAALKEGGMSQENIDALDRLGSSDLNLDYELTNTNL